MWFSAIKPKVVKSVLRAGSAKPDQVVCAFKAQPLVMQRLVMDLSLPMTKGQPWETSRPWVAWVKALLGKADQTRALKDLEESAGKDYTIIPFNVISQKRPAADNLVHIGAITHGSSLLKSQAVETSIVRLSAALTSMPIVDAYLTRSCLLRIFEHVVN